MKIKQIFSFILLLGIGGIADAQVLNNLKKKLEQTVIKTVQPSTADLHLQSSVTPEFTDIGGEVIFTFAVNNKGPETSDNIVARVIVPESYVISGISLTQGEYDKSTQIWEVGSLAAWTRAEMTVSAAVLNGENLMATGEIISSSTKDPDSTPDNGIDTNGNGLIVDDREDEDDADGQDVRIGSPNANTENETATAIEIPSAAPNTNAAKPIAGSQTSNVDNNIVLPESYGFSYECTLGITSSQGDRELVFLMEPDQNYYGKQQSFDDYTQYVVVDNSRFVEVYFAEIKGVKRRGRKKMDLLSIATQIGAFRDSSDTKTTTIGNKTILGFECNGYRLSSELGTTEFWITNEAPATAFGAMFAGRTSSPDALVGSKTMIMEIAFTSAENAGNDYRVECKKYTQAPRQFLLNDYTE